MRRDCCSLIGRLKAVPGIEKVTITTNGVLLDRYLDELMDAGIDGINISLDTLDRELYRDITGTDALGRVLDVLGKASKGTAPVKINAVSLDFGRKAKAGEPGGWKQLADLAEEFPVDVRFIEMMPIGCGKNFMAMNHQELLEEMRRAYPHMEQTTGFTASARPCIIRFRDLREASGLSAQFTENSAGTATGSGLPPRAI